MTTPTGRDSLRSAAFNLLLERCDRAFELDELGQTADFDATEKLIKDSLSIGCIARVFRQLAAVTRERDEARALLGEFTGAVMWGHPTWAFDGNPRSALGWLREDYELIRAFSAVNTKQEQELAATRAKLERAVRAIKAFRCAWKAQQTDRMKSADEYAARILREIEPASTTEGQANG